MTIHWTIFIPASVFTVFTMIMWVLSIEPDLKHKGAPSWQVLWMIPIAFWIALLVFFGLALGIALALKIRP